MNDTLTLVGSSPQNTISNNRQVRAAVSLFYFCSGLCFATWASRIPDIKSSLNLNDGQFGTILFALPLGQLFTMPLSGRLVAKFGSKNVSKYALILYAIEMSNLALATQPWHLGLALFVFGICGNMNNIAINTQGVAAEQLYHPKPIMTSFHGAWSIAGFTGALVGLCMMALHVKPHQHFMIVAATVILAVFLFNHYLVPGKGEKSEKKPFFSKPDTILIQLGVIGFCSMASEGAMFDWSGVYFKEVVHSPASLVILGYTSFMVMMATGRFLGDWLITQLGRKKLLQICGVLISVGLFTSVLFPYLITATIGFLIVGLGVSSVVPIVYSVAGKSSKLPPSMALAAVTSVSFLGFLMGPPLIGYIAHISSLRYSFALIGIFGFCITILVSKLKVMD